MYVWVEESNDERNDGPPAAGIVFELIPVPLVMLCVRTYQWNNTDYCLLLCLYEVKYVLYVHTYIPMQRCMHRYEVLCSLPNLYSPRK